MLQDFINTGIPARKRRRKIIHQEGETQALQASLQKQKQWKERNDCVVRALSIVTGLPYERIHDECALAGRKNGQGMEPGRYLTILARLGYEVVRVDHRSQGILTYISLLKKSPKGRYLVATRCHLAAFSAGKLHDYDNYLNTRRRVIALHQVIKRRA